MIVKVRMPDVTDPSALVYSKDRKIVMHVPLSAPLTARMKGKREAFFHAESASGVIELGEDAPAQDW